MAASGIGPGDEVIVPAMTFVASANCAVYVGARPIPVDVDPASLLLDPALAEQAVTPRTRAIVAVDYAGQPCDYSALRTLAARYGLLLVADACHAPGAQEHGRPVGSLADATAFSFHPVKPMTTGEGGMITTDDVELASRIRVLRSHGITTDWRTREARNDPAYEMTHLGFNYRLTDLQCALGLSQLRRLEESRVRRAAIAEAYDAAFGDLPGIRPLARRSGVTHAHHLYVVRIDPARINASRAQLYAAFRAEGIGVNVHYIPFHLHPYYRERFGTGEGTCPVAEQAYRDILTLPCFAGMDDAAVADVIAAVQKIVHWFAA